MRDEKQVSFLPSLEIHDSAKFCLTNILSRFNFVRAWSFTRMFVLEGFFIDESSQGFPCEGPF